VAIGTGAHAWFLLVQTALLTALGLLLGFPFQAQAMIAAIIYVCSRVNPLEKMCVLGAVTPAVCALLCGVHHSVR
jgi:type III secretory pathway component EscV